MSSPFMPISSNLLCFVHVNSTSHPHIGDQPLVLQGEACDWGGGTVLQPVSDGSPLIAVPVRSYHAVHHNSLHASTSLLRLLR